eukprot:gene15981-biopygen13474
MLHAHLIAPIPELLRRHAEARGAKTAFSDRARHITYDQLARRTQNLAGHLAAHGVQAGDKVAILLPNCVSWVEACLAIVRAGGVAVPISYEASAGEIAYRLSDAACKLVITTADRSNVLAGVAAQVPILFCA